MKYISELIGSPAQLMANISAGVVAAMSYAFGELNNAFYFFVVLLICDYVTGLIAAIVEGTGLSSKIGHKGILKKFTMVIVVAISHQIDVLFNTDIIMTGSLYFFISNELISFAENIGRAGVPLPPVIKKAITVLKEKGGVESDIDQKQESNKKNKK